MTKPEGGSLAGLLREVLRSPAAKPKPDADDEVARALRAVFATAPRKPAPRVTAGSKEARPASKSASPAASRLKLARSLAEVRTNIAANADKMTPMEKLRTAQLANELAARLRKL